MHEAKITKIKQEITKYENVTGGKFMEKLWEGRVT